MELLVVFFIFAYFLLAWRQVCRWWIARGGRRWAGHGLGFIAGNLASVVLALPMIPGAERQPSAGGLIYGFIIFSVFMFFEVRYRKGKRRFAPEPEQAPTVQTAEAKPDRPTEIGKSGGLGFSLRETAEMILADDVVDQREAELLLKMLDDEDISRFDPVCRELHQVLVGSLDDGFLDNEEAEEIKVLLSEICDRPIERTEKPSPAKRKTSKPKPKRDLKAERKRAAKAAMTADSREPSTDDVIAFSYTDSRGGVSDRHLTYRGSSQKNGVLYVKGICHDRRAFRTFRADRMEFVCFADTGEMVESLTN